MFQINGETEIYGIIGYPVEHSFSPKMQTAAFQHRNINAVYLPFPTPPENLNKTIQSLHYLPIKGLNITVPFKGEVIELLDFVDEDAKRIGSVNTIKIRDGKTFGYSTDGDGFVRSLKKDIPELYDLNVVMIGAGGAAKAIAYSLLKEKVGSLTILNRTKQKALDLKKTLLDFFPKSKVQTTEELETFDLLINTTSVGMNGKDLSASEELIDKCDFISDIIYNPEMPPLLKKAAEKNKPHQNGLGMLLHQGTKAFEIWTGQEAPSKIMKEVLETLCKT